jgi:STE24 endopeptidase
MNTFMIIILTALIADYVIKITTELLNLKALDENVPKEFEGVYDAERYKKSQEYARVNTRFGFITSTWGLAVVLVFWFGGGFNWLDQIVRGMVSNAIWAGLIFAGFLLIAKTIISMPFKIYRTFVIEERFGFNKTTPATFVTDFIKSLVLGTVIGGILFAGVLLFFEYTGSLAWLYCWVATTLFTIFLQFIAPTWIMPLFNKFTPLESGELKNSILSYADKVHFSVKGLFVMDGSRRSSKSNAFFTGFGKNKRIALFDTLIEKHTVGELVAVLAHEIGHYKKKHIVKSMIISIVHSGILFYILSIFIYKQGLFDAFYMDQMSIYVGLIFFSMLYTPVEMVLSVLMSIFSRKNEYEADRYAVETTNKPDDMINALKKLSVDNLSNLTPHPLYVFLNYSHPPVLKRIEAIWAV